MDHNPDIDKELSKIGLDKEGIKKELERLLREVAMPKDEIATCIEGMLQFLNMGFYYGLGGTRTPAKILEKPDSTLPPDLERLTTGVYAIGERAGAFLNEGKYDEITCIMAYMHIKSNVLYQFIGLESTADLEGSMLSQLFGETQH